MPNLSPQTLTKSEQTAILVATKAAIRDHVIISLALGTGLRLAEVVGLNVNDTFFSDGAPRARIRLRPDLAKNGRAGNIFIPEFPTPQAQAILVVQEKAPRIPRPRRPTFLFPVAPSHLKTPGSACIPYVAGEGRIRPTVSLPHAPAHTAVTNVYRATHDLYSLPSGSRGTRVR